MNKKENSNPKKLRPYNNESNKMNTSEKAKKKNDKSLPWWVEFLFVQIGLPDILLIKILKAKKKSKELLNKIDCVDIAKNYITKNKNIILINKKELRMLSINFCNGGEEIYEIENLKN